jgi:hypothetical protein
MDSCRVPGTFHDVFKRQTARQAKVFVPMELATTA